MNKNIFILGGNSGIGKRITELLVRNPDHKVFVLGRSEEKLRKLSKELHVETFKVDITKKKDIYKLIQWISKSKISVDVLISTAGIFTKKELDLENVDTIEDIIDINFKGNTLLFKAFIPLLKKVKYSHLIYINSGMGLKPNAEKAIYSASKWAMTGLMNSLEKELSRYKIKVTSIYPNKTNTFIFNEEIDMSNAIEPTEIAKIVQFILGLDPKTVITNISLKHIDHSSKAVFEKKAYDTTYILERKQ